VTKFANHASLKRPTALPLQAADVPLPDDEGLEDEVVEENLASSECVAAVHTEDAPAQQVLGARRLVGDVVAGVVNVLGFSIDADEKQAMTDSAYERRVRGVDASSSAMKQLKQAYAAKGLADTAAGMVATDDLVMQSVSRAVGDVVLEVALQCMITLIHKSARYARPTVRSLNPRWSSLFTLAAIKGGGEEPSLLEYTCRCLEGYDEIHAADSTLAPGIAYADAYRRLGLQLDDALSNDDVARSVQAIADAPHDASAPVWPSLKPSRDDRQ
jgi:hypothetical protein